MAVIAMDNGRPVLLSETGHPQRLVLKASNIGEPDIIKKYVFVYSLKPGRPRH